MSAINYCKMIRKELKLSIEELSVKIREERGYLWLLDHGYDHRVPIETQERIKKKLEDLHEEKRETLL